MNAETLFDFEAPDDRAGNPNVRHVLMPNMAYACGGSILTRAGTFGVGASNWDAITCPECRACGQDALQAEIRAQQGRQESVA